MSSLSLKPKTVRKCTKSAKMLRISQEISDILCCQQNVRKHHILCYLFDIQFVSVHLIRGLWSFTLPKKYLIVTISSYRKSIYRMERVVGFIALNLLNNVRNF